MNLAEIHAELPTDRPARGLLGLAERGWLPDSVIRLGIRRLCEQRLRDEAKGGIEAQIQRQQVLLDALCESPIAIHTDRANAQHYEVPAEFFQLCLGKRLKYSACLYPAGRETLDDAEERMLALYAERAQLEDGQDILELGCGWGSLTLWMAEQYPNARIVAVSNSHRQRVHIQQQCRLRSLENVRVITCDVNQLDLPGADFDRCVSVEMFEHLRNYRTLFERIAGWLKPGGLMFTHVFAHRTLMYPFETQGEDNWLGRHFFTGGLMPSSETFLHFQAHLRLQQRWLLDGRHYQRTAEHWLENHDRHAAQVMDLFTAHLGEQQARLAHQRWRMFWMACAELFGYRDGQEWLVAHYRFERRA